MLKNLSKSQLIKERLIFNVFFLTDLDGLHNSWLSLTSLAVSISLASLARSSGREVAGPVENSLNLNVKMQIERLKYLLEILLDTEVFTATQNVPGTSREVHQLVVPR